MPDSVLTTATLTITVNPNITPTFTAVAPICSGATLTPLPTTSNNGITGTWAPALDNTATTTYTFTPACRTVRYYCYIDNYSEFKHYTNIYSCCTNMFRSYFIAACQLLLIMALPVHGRQLWIIRLQQHIPLLQQPGSVLSTATMTIVVSSSITPTFTAVAPICSGATLHHYQLLLIMALPVRWAPALDNTTTTTYTFTPDAGQCATTATLTIMVSSNITPTFTAVAPICSGATLSPLPTTSNNGITGTLGASFG